MTDTAVELETVKPADRLRPNWPAASRTSVQWNIDYLAVKLRLKHGPARTDQGPRLNNKKEALVSLALRFDLVRENDLVVLELTNASLRRGTLMPPDSMPDTAREPAGACSRG